MFSRPPRRRRAQVRPDDEEVADAGRWSQLIFARNGVRLSEAWSGRFPATEAVLAGLGAVGGVADRLPKGSMEVSILGGGAHLKPHCGPTNHRLRLHLPLRVAAGARIRAADEVRVWEEGRLLVLDDSFEHEVWNPAAHERIVLLVDVWHPQLTADEREDVRRHFRFDEASWWTLHSPWGRGVVR